MNNDFIYQKVSIIAPLEELSPAIRAALPELKAEKPQAASSITIVERKRDTENGTHYFMGGLPALMQAVRLLEDDPKAHVTYVNDGQIKKSTQSAHQGHVHPTEWTTPELGIWQLTKLVLNSLKLYPSVDPEDVLHYSYVHFPLANIKLSLFIKNIAFKLRRALVAKNGISPDDRWQCDAVRASLSYHKALSDKIVAAGGEPTFISDWRLIWSPDKEGIERKKQLWEDLGIKTAYITQDEIRRETLLRDDIPLYGLKIFGDGKFFADVDKKIVTYLLKQYPERFTFRTAAVTEVHVDKTPFAVVEDGKKVAVASFYGSTGHNQVFKAGKQLWDEVPVTGVSTLWVCTLDKKAALARYGTLEHLKNLPGGANLTNLHTTIWNVTEEGDQVHIIVRATEGANFNSPYADPRD
ncbi:MAG: hypothetical protein JSS12_06625, partial [Verrucomicrobia bacterium]|nr:hypothetical protein [Verrucomicrobiota bacterium]